MKLFSVTTLLAALSLGASAAAHERCGNRADAPVAAGRHKRLAPPLQLIKPSRG